MNDTQLAEEQSEASMNLKGLDKGRADYYELRHGKAPAKLAMTEMIKSEDFGSKAATNELTVYDLRHIDRGDTSELQ